MLFRSFMCLWQKGIICDDFDPSVPSGGFSTRTTRDDLLKSENRVCVIWLELWNDFPACSEWNTSSYLSLCDLCPSCLPYGIIRPILPFTPQSCTPHCLPLEVGNMSGSPLPPYTALSQMLSFLAAVIFPFSVWLFRLQVLTWMCT